MSDTNVLTSNAISNVQYVKAVPIQRTWVMELCDCCKYKDNQGVNPCFPVFCPIALFITGITAGQVCTHIHHEKPCCFGMGSLGLAVCATSTPISCYSVPGGVLCFFFLSWYQRNAVIAEFGVTEERPCECLPCCRDPVTFCHFHCNYPCSMYQILMSLREWKENTAFTAKAI